MASLHPVPVPPGAPPSADLVCLQVAVGVLRAVAGPQSGGSDLFLPRCAHLRRAENAFRAFHAAAGARPVCTGSWFATALSKDERRLLRALAAAQAGDAALLDNYLYKLALDQSCRACLAEAVCALAVALANAGYAVPVCNGEIGRSAQHAGKQDARIADTN